MSSCSSLSDPASEVILRAMNVGGVRTIMAFVNDPAAAARFWSDALEAPLSEDLPLVNLGGVKLFFHRADDQNRQGGTVAYFGVKDFDRARESLLAAGCAPHRGPLALPDGRRICQLRDPFGSVWGLESDS
jgi:predicted enzyme related to lactoylglutathione lyase